MPSFKCTKCGATATSKCPSRRTVFLDQEFAAIYNMVIPATLKKCDGENDLYHVTLMPKCISAGTKSEAFLKALALCAELHNKKETAKIWACDRHDWVRTSPGTNCGAGEIDVCTCTRQDEK